ncbi:hypothetical protein JVT61DRAFT_14901 [Boletus reticuloceps]|uniref:DNA-directed RNA polymerase subunit n=1 Tax=Boletus reticuloceps TaxID=495285 RepID=A0A8I2YCG5_9AGAM|nr:hypothetical protein JVT61DRAFT_14901 [Boletus reticuloceps]
MMRREDDLTYKLRDVIKASTNIRQCKREGAPTHVIMEFEQLLQGSFTLRLTSMDSDIAGIPQALQKSGHLVKAIHAPPERKGRPSPWKSWHSSEKGLNIAYLQELARNGPSTYPGADFDGDEMNMCIPKSEETRAELSQIAWVPRQRTTRYGYRTGHVVRYPQVYPARHVQNILLWLPDWDGNVPTPAIIKPKPRWTGKQILIMVIPRGINIHRAPDPKSWNPVFDDGMMVDNGEILFGIMDKKTVGATQGGLIHVVFREKGPEAMRSVFTGIQMVVNFWLFHNGFCIGIGDTIAGPKVMSYITQRIGEKKQQIVEIIDDAYHDQLKPMPGMTIRESFESKVRAAEDQDVWDVGQGVRA